MPEKKEMPAPCPHVRERGQDQDTPCPLCLEIERMLREGEVPF